MTGIEGFEYFGHHMPHHQWTGLPLYTTASENQRIGSQPTSHAYWLTASLHNGSFLFPYPVLYHYRHVLGKDNDMYIYSTWVTCLVESHRADNPLLSSLKLSLLVLFLSLSLPQQTWGICYLSPNLLCFLSQWFINRVLLSISKDTEEGREERGAKIEREGGSDKRCWKDRVEEEETEREFMNWGVCGTVTHTPCVDIMDSCGAQLWLDDS